MNVRDVGSDDAEALARLTAEFTGIETSPAQMARRLVQSQGVEHPIVAIVEDQVVGFASLRLHYYLGEDVPYAEVSELFVTESFRRQGVARGLMTELEAKAREAGASSVAVLTGTDNESALSLYQAMGFRTFSVALQKWLSGERPYVRDNQD